MHAVSVFSSFDKIYPLLLGFAVLHLINENEVLLLSAPNQKAEGQLSLAEAAQQEWDVIIVGAGVGGATIGYALAKKRKRVLFLERGKFLQKDPNVVAGMKVSEGADETSRLLHGHWPDKIRRNVQGKNHDFHHPLGCGTGGSSVIFGSVMDRFRPADFTPRQFHRGETHASLPERWPINYEELLPYYEEAETLFRVRGTQDQLLSVPCRVLEPPPAMGREIWLTDQLRKSGLHPYRIHYASELNSDCRGCPGTLCAENCRNDAGKICVRPAVEAHGAKLVTDCEVTRIEAQGRAVSGVWCRDLTHDSVKICGKIIVLAAGAYSTPILLLKSATAEYPSGLANSSGMVGRNLMMHTSDWFMLRPRSPLANIPRNLEYGIALNDFYETDGIKLGNVHVHAAWVSKENIISFIQSRMGHLSPWLKKIVRLFIPIVARYKAFASRKDVLFCTIVEDLPYPENRIYLKDGRVTYEYQYPSDLRRRNELLKTKLQRALKPLFKFILRRS